MRQALAAGLGFAGFIVALAIDPDRYRRAQKGASTPITWSLMLLVFPLGDTRRAARSGGSRLGGFQLAAVRVRQAAFVTRRWRGFPCRPRPEDARAAGRPADGRARARTDPARLQATRSRHRAGLHGRGRRLPVRGRHPLEPPRHPRVDRCARDRQRHLVPARRGIEILQPYQTARLTGFTNPDSDPSGATYNVTQSITAVGSGGLNGRGVEGATQTRLDYLPEHHTDFVFAALAEQRGFFGAAVLLGLYLLVVWRGLRVIAVARDAFSAIVAGGIVIAFLFQIFVNVGMTMGIAPVTGIPLPFVTVGGSSMVANLIAIGVLQSIHARGHQGRRRPR